MDRRLVPSLAAVALVLGWGAMLAVPLVQADQVAWSAGLSWHVHCETMVLPVRGAERCVTEVGALGAAAAVVGVVAGVAALVALARGAAPGRVARAGAVLSGLALAVGVVVGVARNFAGPAELPFDAAALAFAVLPARGLAAARRVRDAPVRRPTVPAS